ncbi:MAG: SDR family NAD(P)-dependent oxidoreductase [Undibacterium sp.]|uniref:SDR family NAD(P)-dependent oxidoreductase n=1 Tax=Undibacterium sp. TaxID=1914977 RepID=UPI002724E83A|nr:SDR family NAD(P)-dependent oxidoreductase [Undibacterium sp.]MDO8653791.1 SDR family NAD(P)-dependent oxidoreductase [Undibacterium sp.]
MDYSQKSILVSGGTGSFGNFIVRRLLDLGAKEVRVLSRDEKKQHDMRVFYRGRSNLSFVIGDVRNRDRLDEAMSGIDIMFHAAALKQVPTCEDFIHEAIHTNVTGAQNVVDAALRNKLESFVMISTDKAVKPVNVMGMTKALQERIVLKGNRSRLNTVGTRFACVRYGNVLNSRGSVIPLFRRLLATGQRLKITDDRMTRFLLTLNDAIDLVLFAAEQQQGGEIFVRKAPAARITDLAAIISEEAGKALAYDLIGMLPGEKLNEIMLTEEELIRTEDLGDYYKIHPWWSKVSLNDMDNEYSSFDSIVDKDQIKLLLARSDQEFQAMEMAAGEFSNF